MLGHKNRVLIVTVIDCQCLASSRMYLKHPVVAENIAPIGGPGSDVIVEGIPP